MTILKKRLEKLQRIVKLLFVISFLFISSACGGPNAYLCTIDLTPPESDWHLFCVNMKSGDEKNVRIKDAHKFIAFSPDDYSTVKTYLSERCR